MLLCLDDDDAIFGNAFLFEFQEPLFVAFVCTVVVVFALNLLGVFEIRFDAGQLAAIYQEIYTLTNEDLVIADSEKPIALAGVIGGMNSHITTETKNIATRWGRWFSGTRNIKVPSSGERYAY